MNEERDTDERLWHPWLRILPMQLRVGDRLTDETDHRTRAANLAATRASKRSETSGRVVDLATDAIRVSGFCGMRFGHVRAWATTDSLRSPPQSRQR
jgi:hypothetical protein